jgi:hypothetical protein
MEEQERNKAFWMQFRQGLLVIIGAIEGMLEINPKTSDLRRRWRESLPKQQGEDQNQS